MKAHDNRTLPSEVLIVGAGPVGLALAVELRLRGIDVQVIDGIRDIGHWWTRAMNMNKRTMEHMRRWGLSERLKAINYVPRGWPSNVALIERHGGRQIACARAEGLGWGRTLPDASEDALWVAQGQVQQVLLEHARKLGARVTFDACATELLCNADGTVQVFGRTTVGSRTWHARYVVGCDGSHSFVRTAVGIACGGAGPLSRQISIFFRAPNLLDAMRSHGIADSVMYFCADTVTPGTSRLICGDRWEFTYRPPQPVDESRFDPHPVLRNLLGSDCHYTLERVYPFSYAEQIAAELRAGPVFLAGDAAHTIPPLGGHNLNLGFGDAVNLGWKLAHVLRGWAGDALLDSFGRERLPMIARTAHEARQNYERLHATFARLATWMTLRADDDRNRLGEAIARDLEPQWRSDGTVLDQRYEDSPVIAAESTRAPPYDPTRYQGAALPGHRAPMYRDTFGTPLYDRLGAEYTLLDVATDREPGLLLHRRLCKHIPVSYLHLPEPALRERYGAHFTLIRPDQHIAWRADTAPLDIEALVTHITGHPSPDQRRSA
ncbi:FAD-dependent monooxygenase [Paraburkholderia sp. J63]|uniref:FAD-dependent monooxygenase n=1 Tax=Paraburkholderia sp. J63 TaxID=2805434 RepID=UPI002ABD5337|nr:FAD-dependent monooxygenase [Paraburkholderia sp. J63]